MTLHNAIIFSLLGHGIILMSWPVVVDLSVASSPSTSYQVTLSERQPKKESQKKTEKADSQLEKKTKQLKSAHIQKNIATSLNENKNEILEKKKNTETKAYVISHINHKIRNNFIYPRLALRNGWEGKVILSLLVNSKGNIENAHVKSGSGHRILDQSALNTLLKIKQVEITKNWFKLNHQEIIIPVIYQLQEG